MKKTLRIPIGFALLLTLSGCGVKLPTNFEKPLSNKATSHLNDHEINSIISSRVRLKFRDKHSGTYSSGFLNSVDYNYAFDIKDKKVKGYFSGGCYRNRQREPKSECESWNFYAPYKTFLTNIATVKEYFKKDHYVNLVSKFNTIKNKLNQCKKDFKLPTIGIDENKVFNGFGKLINASVSNKPANLLEYRNNDINSFSCNDIKDTYTVRLSSDVIKVEPSEYTLSYSKIDKNTNEFPKYILNNVYYKFFQNPYVVADEYIKVTMTPKAYLNELNPNITLTNETNEFLELQGISIYYGKKVFDYLGSGDSHIDVAPETTSAVHPNKLFKNLEKWQRIFSSKDTLKIGLAIKYKIKSTNKIKTLYKTVLLPINE